MKRSVCSLFVVLALLQSACGGAARSERAVVTEPQGARPRTLAEILGPLGAHQTPAQLAEIAAFIHRWERDPYGPVPENTSDISTPTVMLMWLTESPDVSVVITAALTSLAEGRGADVGGPVVMGSTFGMAAYLAEHPGVAGADPDVQTAGVASALLWYEASLRRGDGHNALFDELIAIRDANGVAGLREWWTASVTVH
jgi:hypothetical protein